MIRRVVWIIEKRFWRRWKFIIDKLNSILNIKFSFKFSLQNKLSFEVWSFFPYLSTKMNYIFPPVSGLTLFNLSQLLHKFTFLTGSHTGCARGTACARPWIDANSKLVHTWEKNCYKKLLSYCHQMMSTVLIRSIPAVIAENGLIEAEDFSDDKINELWHISHLRDP